MSAFYQIIDEICQEENISIEKLSDNWILRLKKDEKQTFFYGKLGNLNSAASGHIASDKAATYSLLTANNIPAIPHFLIHKKELQKTQSLKKQSYPLIIKPNHGERGIDIFLCKNEKESKEKIANLLDKYESVCFSPYFEAKFEYRCFYLDGKIYFSYRKNKTDNSIFFNLCRGAKPSLVDQKDEKIKAINKLAIDAAKSIGIRFAAIDILESKTRDFKVLEINQAFGVDKLIDAIPEAYEEIKELYRQAIIKM